MQLAKHERTKHKLYSMLSTMPNRAYLGNHVACRTYLLRSEAVSAEPLATLLDPILSKQASGVRCTSEHVSCDTAVVSATWRCCPCQGLITLKEGTSSCGDDGGDDGPLGVTQLQRFMVVTAREARPVRFA